MRILTEDKEFEERYDALTEAGREAYEHVTTTENHSKISCPRPSRAMCSYWQDYESAIEKLGDR
jgi:hypothetical protein